MQFSGYMLKCFMNLAGFSLLLRAEKLKQWLSNCTEHYCINDIETTLLKICIEVLFHLVEFWSTLLPQHTHAHTLFSGGI